MILVVDISASSRTVAAVVHGLASFDPAVRIAGVILNKAGSARHATEVRQALESRGMPVVGVLHRDDGISAPSRHLGLVPAAERGDARPRPRPAGGADRRAGRPGRGGPDRRHRTRSRAGAVGSRSGTCALVAARSATLGWAGGRWSPSPAAGRSPSATRRPTNCCVAAGCRPVVFDPVEAEALPADTSGVYLGGGFPEVHAAAWPGTARCGPRWPVRSAPASRRSPSAPGCCTCPGRSTAPPWSARSTPTRR